MGEDDDHRDPCETEALRAYAHTLKLCELANNPNPRLRCYEAAKAVYVQTLEDCHRLHHSAD
jgi:hypothetical protein